MSVPAAAPQTTLADLLGTYQTADDIDEEDVPFFLRSEPRPDSGVLFEAFVFTFGEDFKKLVKLNGGGISCNA